MNTAIKEGHQPAGHHHTIEVRVRYIGAHKHYVDLHAKVDETLATLKHHVLGFFGLVEGAVNNGTKVYTFAHDDIELTNLSQTLGQLANGKHEVKLDLLEQFEQG
jgi:hypothetical protein